MAHRINVLYVLNKRIVCFGYVYCILWIDTLYVSDNSLCVIDTEDCDYLIFIETYFTDIHLY